MHWINVVALTVMFMSGLQIFNAYPVLHFGKSSYDGTPHALEIGARMEGPHAIGVTRIFGREFDTTGYAGPGARCARRTGPVDVPDMDDAARLQWLSMARSVAFLLRMDLPAERTLLRRVCDR